MAAAWIYSSEKMVIRQDGDIFVVGSVAWNAAGNDGYVNAIIDGPMAPSEAESLAAKLAAAEVHGRRARERDAN